MGVALVTLFTADGAVDADATAAHAARLVAAGIQAVLVAGTTGEPWTLSQQEQSALVRAVVGAVRGAAPVIVGVRGDDAVERGIEALAEGADALLALSPRDHLDSYYRDVEAVGLPVLAYHFPKVSPPGIAVSALQRLPVVGIKDSSGDVHRLREELSSWSKPVYTGSARIVREAARMGAAGALLSVANLDAAAAIAAFAGDVDAQEALPSVEVPELKRLMAARFGTSPVTRA